jgi:SSS family solute:Na+ symporter
MSEYIGAKSTIGTAQAAFEDGFAASWSVIGAAIGFPLFGLLLVKRIYSTGKITISGAIAEKYGTSTTRYRDFRGVCRGDQPVYFDPGWHA